MIIMSKVLTGALKAGVGLVTTAAVAVGLDKAIPTNEIQSRLEKKLVEVGKFVLGAVIVGAVTTAVITESTKKNE